MNDEVCFCHADKNRGVVQVGTRMWGCMGKSMPKGLERKSLHIFAISPETSGDGVDFLLVDKR